MCVHACHSTLSQLFEVTDRRVLCLVFTAVTMMIHNSATAGIMSSSPIVRGYLLLTVHWDREKKTASGLFLTLLQDLTVLFFWQVFSSAFCLKKYSDLLAFCGCSIARCCFNLAGVTVLFATEDRLHIVVFHRFSIKPSSSLFSLGGWFGGFKIFSINSANSSLCSRHCGVWWLKAIRAMMMWCVTTYQYLFWLSTGVRNEYHSVVDVYKCQSYESEQFCHLFLRPAGCRDPALISKYYMMNLNKKTRRIISWSFISKTDIRVGIKFLSDFG